MDSSWVQAVFDPYSTYSNSIQISLDTVFDTSRSDSNPARNVRMQWSISLMVSTTPPSGFVNAPARARERLYFEPGFEPGSSRVSMCIKYCVQESYLDMVFDMSRIQLEAFECNGVNTCLLAPVCPRLGS